MDKEKKDFILKRGVLGVGLPTAVLAGVIAGYQVPAQPTHFQNFSLSTSLFSFALFAPVFVIAGYFWGIYVYKHIRKK